MFVLRLRGCLSLRRCASSGLRGRLSLRRHVDAGLDWRLCGCVSLQWRVVGFCVAVRVSDGMLVLVCVDVIWVEV